MIDIELNAAQVERALLILQQELKALTISQSQERWLRRFRLFTATATILYLIGLIILGFAFYDEKNLNLFFSSNIASFIALSIFVLYTILALTLPLFLLINSKLILTLYKQRNLMQRYGLNDLQNHLWKEHHPKRQFVDYCISGGAIIGFLYLISLVVFYFLDFTDIDGSYLNLLPKLHLIILFILGLSFIAPWFIQRLKQRIDLLTNIERLKLMLEHRKENKDTEPTANITIPRQQAMQISAIESAHINRERIQAISDHNQANNEHSLLISREVKELLSNLCLDQRLILEETLDNLLLEPHPASSKESTPMGNLKLTVPEIGIIEYKIDEGCKQINIVSLDLDAKSINCIS